MKQDDIFVEEIRNLTRIDNRIKVSFNLITNNILYISTEYNSPNSKITTIGRVTDDSLENPHYKVDNRKYDLIIKVTDNNTGEGYETTQEELNIGYYVPIDDYSRFYVDLLHSIHSDFGLDSIELGGEVQLGRIKTVGGRQFNKGELMSLEPLMVD